MNAISPNAPEVPDGTDAERFLLEWTARWRPEWYLNLCAVSANGGPPVGRSWCVRDLRTTPGEAARFIQSHNGRHSGIYFTYNPLRHAVHTKPEKLDLAAVVALALDLDPPKDSRPYQDRRRDAEALAAFLCQGAGLPYAAAVDSGNGFGMFYLLPEPLGREDLGIAEAASALLHRTVSAQVKVDGTHNADRLMRLPHTLNWPNKTKLKDGYPSTPRRASLLASPMTSLPVSVWSELVALAIPPAASSVASASTASAASTSEKSGAIIERLTSEWPVITATSSLDDLAPALLVRFADALERHPHLAARWSGDAEGLRDASRSGLLFAFVGGLKRAGFDVDDAARLAWVYPFGDLADTEKLPTAPDAIRAFARAWCNSGSTSGSPAGLPGGFEMTPRGLVHRDEPSDRNPAPRATWVCGPHQVPFDCHDEAGARCGLVMQWGRPDQKAHNTVIIDRRGLHTEFATLVGNLEDRGLRCDPSPKGHALLKVYLSRIEPARTALVVRRGGWHGDTFIMPNGRVIGDAAQPVMLHPDAALSDRSFDEAGTLEEWQAEVGRYAIGNSRIALAICAALAAPLLRLLHAESGGLHFVGSSRVGKTTLLRAAGSVWGLGDAKGGQVRQWRATANGLEGLASALSDTPLILDEIGQANPKDLSDIVYMLANEAGKARADRSGGMRRAQTWRALMVSSGETTVGQRLRQLNQPEPAGLQVRLLNIPADAKASMGVFETLHGFATPSALAEHLRGATIRTYGSAARAFLTRLTEAQSRHSDDLACVLRELRDEFVASYLPPGASGQVKTAAARLGLAAAAGELAVSFGVLNWPENEATLAAATCFTAWLDERGGIEAGEELAALSAIRKFLLAHGESRFEPIEAAKAAIRADLDGHDVRVSNRVGWRRLVADRWEYLIPPEAWRGEVCKDVSPKLAVAVLGDLNHLERDADGFTPKVMIPGRGRMRVYIVRSTIFDGG